MSDTFKHSYIKLIPKNNDKIKNMNGLRPISLTKYEYRLLTNILTNRMSNIGNLLLGEHQTCSIMGRRMNDNIIMLRGLINNVNVKNSCSKFIKRIIYTMSCDQKNI